VSRVRITLTDAKREDLMFTRAMLTGLLSCASAAALFVGSGSASPLVEEGNMGYGQGKVAGTLRADSSYVTSYIMPLSDGRFRTYVAGTVRDRGAGDGYCGRIEINLHGDNGHTINGKPFAYKECHGIYRRFGFSATSSVKPYLIERRLGWTNFSHPEDPLGITVPVGTVIYDN